MNSFFEAVRDASAMHGELRRIFLTAGAVMLVACIFWAIQEWGLRKVTEISFRWFVGACLCAVGAGGLYLFSLGMRGW